MKNRLFAFLFLMVAIASANAQTIYTGHWFSPDEPGRGMNIDHQNGVLVANVYAYNADGSAQWWQAAGPTSYSSGEGKITFSQSLTKYRNGQCLTCSYSGSPSSSEDGHLEIVFQTETRAEVTFPGDRKSAMVPYRFGVGDKAHGMLGMWFFTYVINTSVYTVPYQFASIETSQGVTMAMTANGRAGCVPREDIAREVMVCVELTATGTAKRYYMFRMGIDKTYSGLTSTSSNFTTTSPPMVGYRLTWPNGQEKSLSVEEKAFFVEEDGIDLPREEAVRLLGEALLQYDGQVPEKF